jgi:hypothetical protein
MSNWIYTIDLKSIWEKYEDYDHEDYDNDCDLFVNMKNEMIGAIKNQLAPGHHKEIANVLTGLREAKHLSSFNRLWDQLYDFCDAKKIWLKTQF